MWGKYHNLRISSSYIEMWEKIVKEAGVSDPTPTFYQHTGHTVFKEVVKIRHPLNTSSSQMAPQPLPINHMEANALRYFSGKLYEHNVNTASYTVPYRIHS